MNRLRAMAAAQMLVDEQADLLRSPSGRVAVWHALEDSGFSVEEIEAAFFGNGHELRWQDKPTARMMPAC